MELGQQFSACALLVLCVTWSANGGNILVWYTEGSHWINMKPLLETLIDRGHNVTVLVPSVSMYMNSNEASRFHYEPFNVSFSMEAMEEHVKNFLHFSMYEMARMNYLQISMRLMDIMKVNLQFSLTYLDGVVKSDTIMKKLKEGNYDLLLADPIYPGSDLAAEILNIPLVFSLRFSLAHNWERHCGQLPAPPSFVPAAMSKLTDKMDFSERLWNFLFYAMQDILLDNIFWKVLDKYYSEVKGTPTSACEMMSRADIWLMRTYWDFDFPRPLLPNFKFVGGIHCRPAKPLPEDLEKFVESSGDDGIVVFTLGSIINNITTEKANMIASALAQIPQKPENMVHVKSKGAALIVDFDSMKTEDLKDALNAVINEKSYKENAILLSSIHHDRPLSPLNEAIFWIEFTIRNKGAKHLRVQAHKLTWYQYHSIDVMAFLVAVVMFLIFLLVKTCRFCFWRSSRIMKKSKRKAE
ncbi:UDP-glucuronosyltransferase 2A1 [Channa argus]|uniref:UDP-glucuronosyltransferase 2A1 n=1 Tax=Channa argus TaxID=215402 RepID=A0A6G1PZ43_CHAAH|nr:UDP-glucuronosyltransferase 2A1 [Channa argus]